MSNCNQSYEITGLEYDENNEVVAIEVRKPKMRFTNYAIIDNVPGFLIQHSSNGFVCIIPYEAGKDINREKALNVAQKICRALQLYDKNTSKN